MVLLMVIPLTAAITTVALLVSTLMGFFLACLTAIATSLIALLALVLLI